MLSRVFETIVGIATLALVIANLVFWIVPFYVVAIVKFVLPIPALRKLCDRTLVAIAELWITCNRGISALHGIEWHIEGVEALRYDQWYLVVSNHQSWVDVFVLQLVFNRRIPFLKFFLKKQLIWLPLLGLAWWALDLPFMHRHSKAEIAKNPQLRGQDLETTRKACEHFQHVPTSVMNFVEGTRFTPEKHRAQESPYRHLLKPKAGGIAFVLACMGNTLHSLLDVTIAYPRPGTSFWDLMCGRISSVKVHVRQEEIPADMLAGNYLEDPEFRMRFQDWVSGFWAEKDALLERMLADKH